MKFMTIQSWKILKRSIFTMILKGARKTQVSKLDRIERKMVDNQDVSRISQILYNSLFILYRHNLSLGYITGYKVHFFLK